MNSNSVSWRHLASSIALVALTAGSASAQEMICAQVITYGQSPTTGNWVAFPTPCDIPEGWSSSATVPTGYTGAAERCVEVADDYSFSLACARYAGRNYQVEFTIPPNAPSLSWVLANVTPVTGDEGTPLTIGATDNGTTITLAQDDTLRLTLSANPSTGYEWAVTAIDPTLLSSDGGNYTSSCTGDALTGCPGETHFEFTALTTGTTEVRLAYFRSWEGEGSAAEEYAVTVIVE